MPQGEINLYVVNTEENHSFLVNSKTSLNAMKIVEKRGFIPLDYNEFTIPLNGSKDIENILM